MDYNKLSVETLKALQEGREPDYNKLSVDELNELSKLSDEPAAAALTSTMPMPEVPSMSESMLRGAAQGASFGFADEATALGESLLSDKTYDQSLGESRQNYKASEEENPMTYTLSNILGGFAVPAGAIGAVGKGATLGARALQGAKAGAAAGALSAAGTAEGDKLSMDTAKEMGSGALIGGGLGGILGGVLPAAGNKLDDLMSEFKPYQVAKGARTAAQEGKELFGSKAKERLMTEARDVSDEYVDELQNSSKRIGKLYGAIEDNAGLKQISVEPTIEELITKKPVMSNPDDLLKLNKIDKTLNNIIQKIERKEITGFMPKGELAKASNQEKIANKINEIVASGNKTAYDSLARYITAREQGIPLGKFTKALEDSGIDSAILRNSEGALTPEALSLAKGMTDPNDISSLSAMLQEAQLLPAPRIVSEIDSQTGLEVIRSVRGDSTISLAVPKQAESLITKIKPVFETKSMVNRPNLSSKELNSAIDDLKGFAYAQDLHPDLKKYLLDSIDTLKGLRDRATKSKLSKVDKAYRTAGEAKAEIGMPANYGTSFQDVAMERSKGKDIARTVEDLFEGDTQGVVSLKKSMDSAKKVSPNIGNIENKMQDVSKDLEIARSLTMESGLGGSKDLGPISKLTQMSARAATSIPFYLTGKAERAITKTIPERLTNIGKSLYSRTPEQMKPVLDTLVQKGSKYAEPLSKALSQPDRKRKALLFSLMQQPGFREDVEDLLGADEEP